MMCLERRELEQFPEQFKPYQKQLSTRFGVVFYEDQTNMPKTLENTIIMLLHKRHAAINKMTTAAKPFWWPRMARYIQQKCEVCIPCYMACKNIEAQKPMTGYVYLPPVEKQTEKSDWFFIGPKKFKHLLISNDRFSRWRLACICATPTRERAKQIPERM